MADAQESDNKYKAMPTQAVAQELVNALQALDNLALVAINDASARLEARRQIGVLSALLKELAGRNQKPEFNSQISWLAASLDKLAENANLKNEDAEPEPEPIAQSELNRRLALNIPAHLSHDNHSRPVANTRKRVLVACLEHNDNTPLLVKQATAGFDREQWDVIDMGDGVPIMMLLSSALEKRPGVVVVVVNKGSLLPETASFVSDIKRKLFGIKVVAVGPVLTAHANVGMRLQADLYAPEVAKAAELAEHALSPLQKMGKPLSLDTDQMPVIPAASLPKMEDLPTTQLEPGEVLPGDAVLEDAPTVHLKSEKEEAQG